MCSHWKEKERHIENNMKLGECSGRPVRWWLCYCPSLLNPPEPVFASLLPLSLSRSLSHILPTTSGLAADSFFRHFFPFLVFSLNFLSHTLLFAHSLLLKYSLCLLFVPAYSVCPQLITLTSHPNDLTTTPRIPITTHHNQKRYRNHGPCLNASMPLRNRRCCQYRGPPEQEESLDSLSRR